LKEGNRVSSRSFQFIHTFFAAPSPTGRGKRLLSCSSKYNFCKPEIECVL